MSDRAERRTRGRRIALWVTAAAILAALVGVVCLAEGALNKKQANAMIYGGVDAVILEIELDNRTMMVSGTGENSIIGDRCVLTLADDTALILGTESAHELQDITLDDFAAGDSVVLFVDQVQESYPTQANAKTVQLVPRGEAVTSVLFPAYDQRSEYNGVVFDIEPFTLTMQLPQGWFVRERGAQEVQYPLMGTWTPLGIYDAQDAYIGAVGYNVYEEYPDAPDVPMAIYNQIALANHYCFNVQPQKDGRGAYVPVAESASGETAVTEVYTSALLRAEQRFQDGESVNPGILCYNRERHIYIAMELERNAVSDEQVLKIAKSIVI